MKWNEFIKEEFAKNKKQGETVPQLIKRLELSAKWAKMKEETKKKEPKPKKDKTVKIKRVKIVKPVEVVQPVQPVQPVEPVRSNKLVTIDYKKETPKMIMENMIKSDSDYIQYLRTNEYFTESLPSDNLMKLIFNVLETHKYGIVTSSPLGELMVYLTNRYWREKPNRPVYVDLKNKWPIVGKYFNKMLAPNPSFNIAQLGVIYDFAHYNRNGTEEAYDSIFLISKEFITMNIKRGNLMLMTNANLGSNNQEFYGKFTPELFDRLIKKYNGNAIQNARTLLEYLSGKNISINIDNSTGFTADQADILAANYSVEFTPSIAADADIIVISKYEVNIIGQSELKEQNIFEYVNETQTKYRYKNKDGEQKEVNKTAVNSVYNFYRVAKPNENVGTEEIKISDITNVSHYDLLKRFAKISGQDFDVLLQIKPNKQQDTLDIDLGMFKSIFDLRDMKKLGFDNGQHLYQFTFN